MVIISRAGRVPLVCLSTVLVTLPLEPRSYHNEIYRSQINIVGDISDADANLVGIHSWSIVVANSFPADIIIILVGSFICIVKLIVEALYVLGPVLNAFCPSFVEEFLVCSLIMLVLLLECTSLLNRRFFFSDEKDVCGVELVLIKD